MLSRVDSMNWSRERTERARVEFERNHALGPEGLAPEKLPRDILEVWWSLQSLSTRQGDAFEAVGAHSPPSHAEWDKPPFRRFREAYQERFGDDPSRRRPWASPIVDTLILKIASRCNIGCDYCYMYTKVDQSWRQQPPFMDKAVFDAVLHRVREYAEWHGLHSFHLVLHGGEPLLLGERRLNEMLECVEQARSSALRLDISLQTNGILLDEFMADLLHRRGVHVGISLDGDIAHNDRHRLTFQGTSTFARVIEALRLLRRAKPHGANALAVVDCDNTPADVIRFFAHELNGELDLLLPDANWDHPPEQARGRYGAWLAAAFDAWCDLGSDQAMPIRLFRNTLRLMFGGASEVESFGGSGVDFLCVETDGSYHDVDTLKTAYEGATRLSGHVHTLGLASLCDSDIVHERVMASALPTACAGCRWAGVCGGGYFPHRFSSTRRFDNPSVYCEDIQVFLDHVKQSVDVRLRKHANRNAVDGAPIA